MTATNSTPFTGDLLFTKRMVKGTSGGALNRIEYIGYAPAGVATSHPAWLVKKIVYDSTGFQTQELFANGRSTWENVWDNYATLSYS